MQLTLPLAVRRALPPAGLLVFGLLAAVALAEVALRVTGFEFRTFPTVQFGWPHPERMVDLYVPDRDLFWVPHGYPGLLAQARLDSPAVVFLGDSCTQFGTYPARTLARLAGMNAGLSTGANLGVGGWSVVQGLAQLERDVLVLRPLAISFYFGWNSHWTALGPPDSAARPDAFTWHLSRHSRLFQLLLKARMKADLEPRHERPNRVDLATYKASLHEMARLSLNAGIRPVFITAPSNHRPGREPAFLAERHLRSLGELVPLHLEYVEATREAARESGATLCDAAATFAAAGKGRDRYFGRDGIHLTGEGDEAMSALLTGCIVESMGPLQGAAASGQAKSAR